MRFIGRGMKTSSYYLSVFTVIILLTGCAHPGRIAGSDLTNLKLGMSKQEVVNILGKPQSASALEEIETYRYFEDHGDFVFLYHTMVFFEDKLMSFTADPQRTQSPRRGYSPRGSDPVLILR